MPDDQPSPEQHRAAAWNAAKRTQRGDRKPGQVKAGMHRKRSDG